MTHLRSHWSHASLQATVFPLALRSLVAARLRVRWRAFHSVLREVEIEQQRTMQEAKLHMKHGLFCRLPADLWYPILQHLHQEDMLALACTCHDSAEVYRNPQVSTFDPPLRCALMLTCCAC
jgi:hypothetical protein